MPILYHVKFIVAIFQEHPDTYECYFVAVNYGAIGSNSVMEFTLDQLDYYGNCNGARIGKPSIPGWTVGIYFANHGSGETLTLKKSIIKFASDDMKNALVCDMETHVFNCNEGCSVFFDCIWTDI